MIISTRKKLYIAAACALILATALAIGHGAKAQESTRVVDWQQIQLCQSLGPAAPHPIWGVDSLSGCGCGEVGWEARGRVNWQAYAQGEYVGHERMPHVPEYRLRVDDQISFLYRMTREETGLPYELQVGDQIRVESLTGDGGTTAGGGTNDNIRRGAKVADSGC